MSDLFGVEWLPLPRVPQMAEIDRRAQEENGVPERLLMETAGRSIALVVDRLFPRGRVAAALGSGHNGGDAYIALRALSTWGRDVVALTDGDRPPNPILAHLWELPTAPAPDAGSIFAGADVILDGLLGTGAAGPPREGTARIIEAINSSGGSVVAVDGPSGVDFSTGQVPGASVNADVTVSLGFPKLGLLFQPARSRCGRIMVAEIGFPPVTADEVGAAVITPAWASARLPARPPDAHKGDLGYLLIVASRFGMAGAAALAARGALAAGAGIVRIASDAANREIHQAAAPETIFVDIDNPDALMEAGKWADALVLGPGFGTDNVALQRLEAALAATEEKPTLIDADGLNLFADRADELAALAQKRPLAITPHPGEMRRLQGVGIDEVIADPVAAAHRAAGRFSAAVLLKGAPSVVASPGTVALVSSSGSSAAASGGSGDVLAGVCGAMLAAGLTPRDALAVGLFYSGRAAELGPVRGRSSLDLVGGLAAALKTPGAEAPPLPFVLFDQPPRR